MSVILISIVVISLLAAALCADGIRVELKRRKAELEDLASPPAVLDFDQHHANERNDNQPEYGFDVHDAPVMSRKN